MLGLIQDGRTDLVKNMLDGFAYLGSGIQSLCIGFLVPETVANANPQVPIFGFARSWQWWPIFMMPFALLGIALAWKLWHELPSATRKYIAETERK